jgi:uncharacterized YigZ family protein
MIESDSYTTIKSTSYGFYKEKGSRFIALAMPFSDPEKIKAIIDTIRKENHEAKHHCYAYMIGHERQIWRVNDDGEPSGTAGRPILGQINSRGLTNILIVVSRYFGGTLLGVSGLINAYKSAAISALQNSEIIKCTLKDYYEITFPYISLNDVMKVLKEENIGQSSQAFDLECRIKINFRLLSKEIILKRLSRIDGLKYRYIETN